MSGMLLINSMSEILLFCWRLPDKTFRAAGRDREGGFPDGECGLTCLLAVSPCPFALTKHLEHERRQITASDTGVLVRFCLSAGPQGALLVFHRAGCDMGAVTSGTPEAQAIALNRVACCFWWAVPLSKEPPNLGQVFSHHHWPLAPNPVTPWLCYHLRHGNRHVHYKHPWRLTRKHSLHCFKLIIQW